MSGARRAPISTAAADRIRERRAIIGGQVREARLRRGWTQAKLAERAGLGRMVVARVERGQSRIDVEVLERLAMALRIWLTVELAKDPQRDVADAGHLAIQELVLRLGRQTGRTTQFELATKPNEPWRSADVAIGSPKEKVAADIECWNTIGDIGAAKRSSDRKVAELAERAVAMWGARGRAALCWVVRDTKRNREILAKYPEVFAKQFPGSSAAWVAALTTVAPIPIEAGLVWCDVKATRLFAWRKPTAPRGRPTTPRGRPAT
ncbi:MAG TPA: helix-turn-helix transcriptional regulator [Candidatus Limnocylindrales bacterium]|nr:helix-turn-helix transcriptional regulator [Candidatus Limnocylindrales bacterium]